MEFMEKCCFVLPLRRGALFLDALVTGLCVVNIAYSVSKIMSDQQLQITELIHVLIFIIVNAAICCLVQFMMYYSVQGYPCKWYIGFSFFVFVLCQIIAIVVVLTAFIELTPVMEIVATTIVLTAVLFYFILVVISIFYQNGEKLRIQEELKLRKSSLHMALASNLKKRCTIPLDPPSDSLDDEIICCS